MMKTTKQTKQTTEWDELVLQKKFGGNFVKEEEEVKERKGTTRTMKKEETNVAIFERERDDENDDDENDEDDEDEEAFMKSYREKRIAEMLFMQKEEKEDEKEEKNNDVRRNEYMMHVSHEQWTKEVTEVSRSHPVLVLLTKENSKACYLLERVMEDVARTYRTSRTKFRRAEARDIIPNYPERNVPTLILYRNGDVVENIVGIEQFGGMNGVNTETVRRRVRMKSDEFLMDRGEEEAKEAEKRREKETAKNG
jgi:hypothetical protein